MALTPALLEAAKANDLAGITAVLTEMDERISRLAAQASRRLEGDHREDFEQDAREALFAALARVETDSVDRAVGFLYASMSDALKDKVRATRYLGVDKDAVKVFMSVMEAAEGDLHRAETLAQTLPAKGSRLSAERAHAARLAYMGAASLDAPLADDGTDAGQTLADRVLTAAPAEEPAIVRPKVGMGAALEALRVLLRYCPIGFDLRGLRMADLVELVPTLEDVVAVPRGADERRYVLDAFAILRSAVSTATEGEVLEELRIVADDLRDQRAQTTNDVHAALSDMSTLQADSLRHSFGISDYTDFGWGDGCDLDGLADALGTTPDNAKKTRYKARKGFAQRFIALVAKTEAAAQAWAAAAAATISNKGRK